jgi:NAD(P)-dependent dehydrogenase (short-subunit alcohol dehydrogenase family)
MSSTSEAAPPPFTPGRFAGRTAIMTGAGSGIGRATDEGVAAVVAAAGGRVDALANVAGIMDAFLPPAEVDDATWERVFAVNVTAPMRLTRAVLPLMLAATITWLLSEDASNVNGAILPSDGGWSAI